MFDSLYNAYDSKNIAISTSILHEYTNKDIPTNIKELFRLVEYLAFNSGQVVSAIKKMTEFPITRTIFKTENAGLREKHENIARKVKYKSESLKVGFDYNMYGNSCTSVYKPIIRYIKCKCNHRLRLVNATFVYEPSTDTFYLKNCPKCHKNEKATIIDVKDKDPSKVNIIRWNLSEIDIKHNKFTGKNTFYYTMSEYEKKKIKDNDIEILSTYPRSFLALAGKNSTYRFKFADDFIFHMKTPCLSGISNVWGYPPPTPAIKSFFYQLMLRKANEAVALDYMNHLRVIYPEMSQPNNDPLKYINMSVWADEMTSTLKKWRKDRNFIKISPHPIGYQALGGEGRGLLLTNEIREASYDILTALGIPKEMMEGTPMRNLGVPIVLRIIENMMMTYMEQMEEWINWVDKKISDWLEVETCEVEYIPFKLIDDIQRKSMLIQWGQGGQIEKISDTTIAEHLDIDMDDEEERVVEDKIRQYKLSKKIEKKIQEEETSLSEKAIMQSQIATGDQVDYNNQQDTMARAEQTAVEIMQMPYEQRKSVLDSMQKEDFVFYSVVKEMMDKVKHQQKQSVLMAAKTASLKSSYPKGVFTKTAEDVVIEELTDKLDTLEKKMEGMKNEDA